MSDADKDDAPAKDLAATKAIAPPPPPRTVAKTMVGVGAPKPLPLPPPAGAARASLFDLDAPARLPLNRTPGAPTPPAAAPAAFPDEPSLFEEDSSLYEVEALRTRPAAARSTAEILINALGQPELAGLVAADAPPTAVEAHHEESFDVTLTIPRPGDSLEERRTRLASRLKTLRSAFKVVGYLDISDDERKDALAMFAEYETRLKAAAGGAAAPAKQDLATLHKALSKDALDDLERVASRIEDKLLALDEYVPQDKFRARITKEKHAPKLILRYARLLACRRFNVGYRRDRFEHLIGELLTAHASDGRLRLLPREKARPVVLQILTGVPAGTGEADRDAAVAYLQESLERLASIATEDEFFDSGFFLDVHGYKISMRDQATSPEFLYLSIALDVEIHNRIEAWIAGIEGSQKANQLSQGGSPREVVLAKLRAQEQAVQAVFSGYRHPKERATQSLGAKPPTPDAKDAKDTAKKDAAKREAAKREATQKKARKAMSGADALREVMRQQTLRLATVVGLALVAGGSLLLSTGVVEVSTSSDRMITEAERTTLSPVIEYAALVDGGKSLRGRVLERAWQPLNAREREHAAEQLRKNMATLGISHAELLAYKTPAIRIENGIITLIDTGK